MEAVERISAQKRGCGYRQECGIYLVSRGSKDGQLPRVILIDPPIIYLPPEGTSSRFRGFIEVDLEKILEGKPYEEYVVGTTANRVERDERRAPEIAAYGMAVQKRLSIGICRADGLEALEQVHEKSFSGLGRCVRRLQWNTTGKAQAEALIVTAHWQKQDWKAMLAAGWRLWFASTTRQRTRVKPHLALLFENLDAHLDALALEEV